MKDYAEKVLGFASDKELCDWAKQFSIDCAAKSCEGIMAVTAPQSEKSFAGVHCVSHVTAIFLVKSLLENICKTKGISPTKILAMLFWYEAQIEKGAVDEQNKTVSASREHDARKFAKYCLQKAISESRKPHFPTLDAQIRKID